MPLYDYKDKKIYTSLNKQDQQLFDFLFPILIKQGYISDSNEQLLNSFKGSFTFKSERALRDHLRVLIESGLIEREMISKYKNNHPYQIRYLYLNKYNFPEFAALKRPSNNYRSLED